MIGKISIRLFRLSDLDRILQIEHASFPEDAYDRKLFADFSHKCGELFLVAVKGRIVCGYLIACIGAKSAARRAELVSIAVDPSYRHKGIAKKLLASALRRLRRRGVDRFHLMVRVTNPIAIRFYENHGFQKTRLARRYYEDGGDGWRMAKCWTAQSK
jgi:[ribosomal protein S18]-alanine N-acetyltransferase